jgi:orotate phosphoribosyltransferase
MLITKRPSLIPPSEEVCDLLKETGALREGHFEFPNGFHSSHYFQMPLAMRYHGNARVLNVALSRMLRREPEVLAALPDCAIVAPAAGGIPVAFGIREALNADQIFWAEKDEGRYHFRQYLDARGIKCIIVDDIVRSGKVIAQMLELVRQAGAEVIAIGSLVHFKDAQLDTGHVPYYSLLDVETQFYSPETCPDCEAGEPLEKVWV